MLVAADLFFSASLSKLPLDDSSYSRFVFQCLWLPHLGLVAEFQNQTIFVKKSTRVGPNSYPGSGGM
jgi:hypothetical protein